MKRLMIIIIIVISISLSADNQKLNYIPLFAWEQLDFSSQKLNTLSSGMIVQGNDMQIISLYKQHNFKQNLKYSYPKKYHSIEFLYEKNYANSQFLTVVKSDSDEPFSGGLHTFQIAAVWGFRLFKNNNLNLILGGGMGVSDFGIEISEGEPLPTIPLPLIRAKYQAKLLTASLDFITGPNFNFVVAPRNKLRINADLRIDNLRDERDLIFDLAAKYRFFSKEHELGDFAGISFGLKNDNRSFDLAKKDDKYDLHFYSLYGEIDFTLIKISAGHTFKNREMHQEEFKFDLDDGFFFAIQALYQF